MLGIHGTSYHLPKSPCFLMYVNDFVVESTVNVFVSQTLAARISRKILGSRLLKLSGGFGLCGIPENLIEALQHKVDFWMFFGSGFGADLGKDILKKQHEKPTECINM